jgi:uncharacterized protein
MKTAIHGATRYGLKVVATLLLAWAAACVCVAANTPIPWMMGPLLAVAGVSTLGGATASYLPLRHAGQWVIGLALGLYFTPAVGRLIASLWWAVVLGVVWALLLGLLFAAWLHRVNQPHIPGLQRATTFFSAAIGGASEMTLLAERHGGQTALVAAAHSLRVLMVTLSIPFAITFSGAMGVEAAVLRLPDGAVHLPGLLALGACSGLGIALMVWLRRANPWFIGALLSSSCLTLADGSLSALPGWLTNAAQLLIGVSLGVRFTPDFLHTAPRWMASVALGTLGLMLLCVGFAGLLALAIDLPMATLVLSTAPGGIAEMAITAKVLQLGVPVVTAFHVCRLVAVLLLAQGVFARWYGPDARP